MGIKNLTHAQKNVLHCALQDFVSDHPYVRGEDDKALAFELLEILANHSYNIVLED